MTSEPILVVARLARAFDDLGIPYLVGGSLASSVYGTPRANQDVDLVADITMTHVDALARALGASFHVDAAMIREGRGSGDLVPETSHRRAAVTNGRNQMKSAWPPLALGALLIVACGQSQIREVGSLERAPAEGTVQEQVAFYVSRLADKDYFEHYSTHEEVPSEWYVAAEELGKIGLPAIPALIQRLEVSEDDYERAQIFYALRLAVQAEDARAVVGNDAPYTTAAFPAPEHHAELKRKWMGWWDAHGVAILTSQIESITNCIHGVARAAVSGRPIRYANVMVVGTTHGAMTGREGFFVIDGLRPGVYQLRVMMIGYKAVTVDSVVVSAAPGCGKSIDVEMEEREAAMTQ